MYAIRIETEDGFSEFGENDVAERNKKNTDPIHRKLPMGLIL